MKTLGLILGIVLCADIVGVVAAASADTRAVNDTPLPPYSVVDGAIPQSLTGTLGDPVKGKAIATDRKLGNCLSCHSIPNAGTDPGTVGPSLQGVGGLLSEGQVRLRIVNPKLVNPATIMPAYYRVAGLSDVAKDFQGKPMLAAQQVEDVVAYLMTLK